MKKLGGIAAIALVAVVGLSACSSNNASGDANWSKIKKNKEIVVATSGTLYPASYHDKSNQLVGYDVDVIRQVAKRLGLKVTFKEYNVEGTLAAVQKGTADLVANDMSTNKARSNKFTLSSPIKYSFGSMIVRKSDDSGIKSFADLKGKKAAGEATTNYMKIAEKLGAKLVSYDNATNDQYLTDVANSRTDVILNDYYLQKMAIAALPDIPVKILPNVYFNEAHSGFLMKKNSTTLTKKINTEIAALKKDGTMQKISQKYFQADVTKKPNVKITKQIDVN